MVRQVMVIVEKQILNDFIDAQIPCAVTSIELRPGMIGVLQRTPVKRKSAVATAPTDQRQIQQIKQSALKDGAEEDFTADPPGRRLVEIAEHRVRARLLCQL